MREFRVDESEGAKGTLITARILVFALGMGVLMFGGIAGFLVFNDQQGGLKEGLPLVACVMAVIGAMTLILSGVMPGIVVSQQRRQIGSAEGGEGKFLQLFITKTILGSALCEGGAFANLIGALVEHQWWSFGIAGVLLLAIVSRFPTVGGMENFVTQQMELAELERGRGE